MPVCVNCAAPADHLYTTYRTKSNIRLGVCPRCDAFLDPLIEHPGLIVLLDLILLKPRAYLHLLYNRGTPPLEAGKPSDKGKDAKDIETSRRDRSIKLRKDLVQLAGATVVCETLSRLLPAIRDDAHIPARSVGGSLLKATVELALQLAASTGLAAILLWLKGWLPVSPISSTDHAHRQEVQDGRRRDFSIILIPLIILYTSIVPLLFQLFISIWYDPPDPSALFIPEPLGLDQFIGPYLGHRLPRKFVDELEAVLQELIHLWYTTDLIWAGTRLLGGLSAGFGLRIALPTRPWETIAIVLVGWGAAGLASDYTHVLETLRNAIT